MNNEIDFHQLDDRWTPTVLQVFYNFILWMAIKATMYIPRYTYVSGNLLILYFLSLGDGWVSERVGLLFEHCILYITIGLLDSIHNDLFNFNTTAEWVDGRNISTCEKYIHTQSGNR
jgi:hypothetical protein